jgi:hypothetical protein
MITFKRILSTILATFITISPCYANKSTRLQKGAKAPFSGTLLDDVKKSLKLDCSYQKQKEKAKLQLKIDQCKVDFKIEKELRKNLRKIDQEEITRLRKIAKPQNNWTPLWITIGFVAGAGTTILILYGINQVNK